VASTFPKVRKNASGYALDAYLASGDLLDLVIGAEGTLGIVVGATWRLEPLPAARIGVRAAIRDSRRLGQVVPALLSSEPARVEYLDATFLRFIGGDGLSIPGFDQLAENGALLLVELEGASAQALGSEVERIVGILRPESLEVGVANSDAETDALWAVRHAASSRLARLGEKRRSLQVIEDACVPVDRLGDYLVTVRQAAEQRGIDVVLFGHAGDGNIHANLLPDTTQPGWLERVREIFDEVSRAVIAMGGSPSGEHGDGRLRAALLERVYGSETTQLFRQLKQVFDPDGILNPGVKLAQATDPLTSLKVGDQAAPLPADIERGLGWIERHVGYSAGRLSLADDPSSWSAAPGSSG
jgi:FAD/FMN-containing dehydrogenase